MNRTVVAFVMGATMALVAGAAGAEESAPAREVKRAEIGTGLVGFSVTSSHGDSITSVGIPSSGTFFTQGPLAYAAFTVSPKVLAEGQLGLTYLSSDGDSAHVLSLAGQLDYLFKDEKVSSPYVFVRARLDNTGGSDDTETHTGLGGGVGYRLRAGDRAVVRFDGRYDHFFGNDPRSDFISASDAPADVFSVALSIGVRL